MSECFVCATCGAVAGREDSDYPIAWRIKRRDGKLISWCPKHRNDADKEHP